MNNQPADHFVEKERRLFGQVDFFYIPASLLIIIVLIFLGFGGQGAPKEKEKDVPQDNTPVLTTVKLSLADYHPKVSTQGLVQALNQSTLSTEVPGKVTFLSNKFTSGNSIKKGEVLLKIDPTPYEAAVANAELQLEIETALSKQAGQELEIVDELQDASDLALRIPQLKQAQANLKQAKSNLEKCTIYAPYDCEVIDRYVNQGESLSIGQPLGEVFSNKDLEIICEISESEFEPFQNIPHHQIQTTLPSFPNSLNKLKIKNISSFVNPTTRSINIILENSHPAQETKIGSYHEVLLTTKQPIKQLFTAPRYAIYENQLIGINEDNTVSCLLYTSDAADD